MRPLSAVVLLTSVLTAATCVFLVNAPAGALAAQASASHPAGPHQHPEAAKTQNPVMASPESIKAGKAVFDTQCASCHGTTGKGDGKMVSMMTPPKPGPADFTDATWIHGATDGELFAVVRDGVRGTAMRGFASRMKPDEIWQVVNYVKSLAP
jgi:mono/diheme cytochrome c family protein